MLIKVGHDVLTAIPYVYLFNRRPTMNMHIVINRIKNINLKSPSQPRGAGISYPV